MYVDGSLFVLLIDSRNTTALGRKCRHYPDFVNFQVGAKLEIPTHLDAINTAFEINFSELVADDKFLCE